MNRARKSARAALHPHHGVVSALNGIEHIPPRPAARLGPAAALLDLTAANLGVKVVEEVRLRRARVGAGAHAVALQVCI
jgi:hypothetical protein